MIKTDQSMALVHPLDTQTPAPEAIVTPFANHPHPLCLEAARVVQEYIVGHADVCESAGEGKMFGVLVVASHGGGKAFLAAYSGLLGGRNDWPWFVPPVFDAQQPDGYFKTHEKEISDINHKIGQLEQSEEYARLKTECDRANREAEEAIAIYNKKVHDAKSVRDMFRLQHNISPEDDARLIRESQFMKAELHRIKKHHQELVDEKATALQQYESHIKQLKEQRRCLSDHLQKWLFAQYEMLNEQGERRNLLEIFKEKGLPPAGSGDCCAPKLLQYAFSKGLKPLCMAEFWWGKPPKTEIRHHLHFYPPCRGKCIPILSWMGVPLPFPKREVTPNKQAHGHSTVVSLPSLEGREEVLIFYEDPCLAVIVKPAGLLSVPGKTDSPSVESLLRKRWNDDVTPLIVHRLDMETSGLMVVARTKWAHYELQRQFANHEVRKSYKAVLDGPWPADRPLEGEISLPLRPDLDDRPRQLVDFVNGKEARTKYRVTLLPPPEVVAPEVREVSAPLPATDGAVDVPAQDSSEALSRGGGGVQRVSKTAISLFPLTGRTHQLRVHCAHPDGIGIPIVGDMLYGWEANRLYLHSAFLSFRHPKSGKMLIFKHEPQWETHFSRNQ